MEFETRKLKKRKPLSDCTNLVPNNYVSRSLAKPKPKPNSKTKSIDTSTGSNIPPNLETLSQLPSTPLRPKSPANIVDADCDLSKIRTVYSRRKLTEKAKNKGKSIAVVPFSCPPARRTSRVGDELEKEHWDSNKWNKERSGDDSSKSCTDPRPQNKKKHQLSLPDLPKDFLDEQKKYYEEVDAFELDEEAVSESDME